MGIFNCAHILLSLLYNSHNCDLNLNSRLRGNSFPKNIPYVSHNHCETHIKNQFNQISASLTSHWRRLTPDGKDHQLQRWVAGGSSNQ